ncbi:MAG: methyltransferase domain-containing protein [Phycisphaerales bacterium]|nr:methyltransferase domain-containing protein [Phycisphaerales bacterium]
MSQSTIERSASVAARAVEVKPGAAGSSLVSPEMRQRADEWLRKFDAIYAEAGGDVSRIPWAHRKPCPSLVRWLDAREREFLRPGARVAVVGCGLGEDAALFAERGYEVVGLDACGHAVESARRLRPRMAGSFVRADVFDLPSNLMKRFDLVVEVHTLQALPPEFREPLAAGMARLLGGRGVLIAICRGRGEGEAMDPAGGPPWALTAGELSGCMASAGLGTLGPIDDFEDENRPPVRRLRGVFGRR